MNLNEEMRKEYWSTLIVGQNLSGAKRVVSITADFDRSQNWGLKNFLWASETLGCFNNFNFVLINAANFLVYEFCANLEVFELFYGFYAILAFFARFIVSFYPLGI